MSLMAPKQQMFQCSPLKTQTRLWPVISMLTCLHGSALLLSPLTTVRRKSSSGLSIEWTCTSFFVLFKGGYKGQSYNSDLPPHRVFYNSISCKLFVSFISRTILDRLATGAISVWGRVGEVEPPHLVMPLTVEPTRPRLCNDNRSLNLWILLLT